MTFANAAAANRPIVRGRGSHVPWACDLPSWGSENPQTPVRMPHAHRPKTTLIMQRPNVPLLLDAIQGIEDVFANHPGGRLDLVALETIDNHAYSIRILTRDPLCRETISYIQDHAHPYYSESGHLGYTQDGMSGLEHLRISLRTATTFLRTRIRQIAASTFEP